MDETNIKVVMTNETDSPPIIKFTQYVKGFFRFGREVKISPKANATLNKAGFKAEYFVDTVSVCIGIGRDHTAELIMTHEDWLALKAGEPIDIETTKQFKSKIG